MAGTIYAGDKNVLKPKVKQIAAGWSHAVALKEDKTVWAWGDNEYGQIVDDITESSKTVEVKGLD